MRQQGQSLLITTGKVWREGYGWEISFLVAALTGFLFFFLFIKGMFHMQKAMVIR